MNAYHHTNILEFITLSQGLESCDQLLADHLAAVTRVYGNYGLGLIDLPALDDPDQVSSVQVSIGATLYWCSEVDAAGILPFVEQLAKKLFSGELNLPIQQGAGLLRPFWRSAEHRFTEPERHSLYNQVLDAGQSGQFHRQLQQVCEGLMAIGRESSDTGIAHLQSRAAHAIHTLAKGLSDRAVGISGFAARDMVRQIRKALNILSNPEINRALGGGAYSFIIQRWSPALLGRSFNTPTHLWLAQQGVELLRWMAGEASGIRENCHLLHRQHPIIRSAEAWHSTARSLPDTVSAGVLT